jgi:proteasome lid subunit RPN8/RPN11
MASTLYLAPRLRAQLEAWGQAGYPEEVCGLLLGLGGDGRGEVLAVCQARNLVTSRARDRFELDPEAFLAADRAAREAGQEILGVWHTHPDHPAVPSETDRAAAWPGWSYVILEVAQGRVAALRSWRLVGEAFEEEEIAS